MTPVALSKRQDAFEGTRLIAFALLSALAILLYRRSATSPLWLAAALAGIALAMWHGAYDAVLGERKLLPSFGQEWKLPFYGGYLGLAALVLLLWWWLPATALVAFLLYSAFHFGTGAEDHLSPWGALSAAALGFVPIAAACRWWPAEVSAIFAEMLRGHQVQAAHVAGAAGQALPLAVVAALGGVLHRPRALGARAALVALELAGFRFCPPVIAFALFFCAWHTPEHLLETSRGPDGSFEPRRMMQNLTKGLLPWLASLAAVALAAWWGRHAALAYLGLVFVALSALTVPHMALALLPEQPQGASHARQGMA